MWLDLKNFLQQITNIHEAHVENTGPAQWRLMLPVVITRKGRVPGETEGNSQNSHIKNVFNASTIAIDEKM